MEHDILVLDDVTINDSKTTELNDFVRNKLYSNVNNYSLIVQEISHFKCTSSLKAKFKHYPINGIIAENCINLKTLPNLSNVVKYYDLSIKSSSRTDENWKESCKYHYSLRGGRFEKNNGCLVLTLSLKMEFSAG